MNRRAILDSLKLDPDRLPITLQEAAATLCEGALSVEFLMAEIKLGRLRASKIGKRYLITRKAFADLQKRRAVGEGGIYVIGFANYIKIGFSRNVDKRVEAIQRNLPEKIAIHRLQDGSRRDEILLHRRFKKYRLNGEWFRHEGEVAEWIQRGCP